MTSIEKLLGGAVVVLLISCAGLTALWRHAQGETRTAALHADSLAAALDTSHHVQLSRGDSIRILGDTLQAIGRRAFQVTQHSDALDRAQGLDRAAIAALTAQVEALATRVTAKAPTVIDSAGTRSATFTIDSVPRHDTLRVSLPAQGRGTLEVRMHMDAASIGLRLGCGASHDGIRSASATLTGPPWLSLELGHVEQTPELCNPTPAHPGFFRRLFDACGVGPSAALIYAEDRRLHSGVGVAASCRAWP